MDKKLLIMLVVIVIAAAAVAWVFWGYSTKTSTGIGMTSDSANQTPSTPNFKQQQATKDDPANQPLPADCAIVKGDGVHTFSQLCRNASPSRICVEAYKKEHDISFTSASGTCTGKIEAENDITTPKACGFMTDAETYQHCINKSANDWAVPAVGDFEETITDYAICCTLSE